MAATLSFALNGHTLSSLDGGDRSHVAFSGNGPDRNNPSSGGVANSGPIPPGNYYIVDRQSGGSLGGMRDWLTNRDLWFALYRDDGTIDDQTFIGAVHRGEFRLHPLGPSARSIGCIVLQYPGEFPALRKFLLAQPVDYIPDTKTRTYGTVEVTPQANDMLDPRYQSGGDSRVA